VNPIMEMLVEEPKVAPAARKPQVHAGLCSTCSSAGNCAFPHEDDQAIIFCEEFEGFAPPVIDEVKAVPQTIAASAKVHEEGQYKGLCVNCERRVDCSLSTSESGIWHCEEYE
jgi:hypothetical protein